MTVKRHGLRAFKRFSTINAQAQSYVPKYEEPDSEILQKFDKFLNRRKRLLVLTGAGVSTESGIPDYRSAEVGRFSRTTAKPIQFQEFIKSESVRQRYWARNAVGWSWFSSLKPNLNHLTVAEWEKRGLVHWLVTQNVDGLHQMAGSKRISELHGSGFRVRCIACREIYPRSEIQQRILTLNPHWEQITATALAPDGDVDLTDEQMTSFNVPKCPNCDSGLFQPDMVFFGDNVPLATVQLVWDKLERADGLLVLGSSLQVLFNLVRSF